MKQKLVVLTGPTGVGKTSLSIGLAKNLNTDVISADSMQIYQHMDIGTAKIMPEEMQGITHFMIDIASPLCDYDVFTYQANVKEIIDRQIKENKISLLVGGTGFYIQSVIYDTDFSKKRDDEYRKYLENLLEKEGIDYVYELLKSVDKEYANTTHKNNTKRVIRALEFYHSEGYPLSMHNKTEQEKESPYDLRYFVLNKDRQKLYKDIDKRVDIMIEKGLCDEAKRIYELGIEENMTAYKALGYNEYFMYFKGLISYDETVDLIKKNSRHYAKRQLTWFRREKNAIWINKDLFNSDNEILDYMMERI